MRKLQQKMENKANEPNAYISPFSPAQRAMLDTVSSGGSNVLMDVGRTLTTSPFNLTRQQLPSQQSRIGGPSQGMASLLGTQTSNGELLDGSFLTQLTLSQSAATKNSNYYQIAASNRLEMSPIPEMNSSKGTNYSATQFKEDDRKLTGTGQYNLD